MTSPPFAKFIDRRGEAVVRLAERTRLRAPLSIGFSLELWLKSDISIYDSFRVMRGIVNVSKKDLCSGERKLFVNEMNKRKEKSIEIAT